LYLLSYAPSAIKQKYLPLLEHAATRGDIGKPSLANFIDKMLLENSLPQKYGTQFRFSNTMEAEYFPVASPDSLAARRKQMGME
jgi:hypothetical protein